MSERPRALVADDDAGIRILVARVLTRKGFDVDSTRDGAEAIEKILQNDYAVIVLDLMMPRLDGFTVVKYLSDKYPQLIDRVIVMTALDRSALAGDIPVMQRCVHKPFDIGSLAEQALSIVAHSAAVNPPV